MKKEQLVKELAKANEKIEQLEKRIRIFNLREKETINSTAAQSRWVNDSIRNYEMELLNR